MENEIKSKGLFQKECDMMILEQPIEFLKQFKDREKDWNEE